LPAISEPAPPMLTWMPWPAKRLMTRPRTVAGAAMVSPLTPAPVAVPFSSISRTALLPLGSVLADDPACE